jgi:purine-cytosine permease-like protein
MDQPTDPLARQLALSTLTTEQFNLQSARMGTIAEANGRSTLYLGTLSSTVIAIAFVGQASELGDTFYLFALAMLPPVFLLGVFSYLRLVQTSIEDMVYAMGTFRIRQYFLGLDPAAGPFFPPTDPQGMTKLERIGVVATGPLQLLLTAASMVGCINAIVGGVTVALVGRKLQASVPVAAVTGAVVALGLAALCFGYQVRRFRRAAGVAPELYEGDSPQLPGWSSA